MKFQLTDLSIEEINTVIAGIMELPGKFSFNLTLKIREQLRQQGVQDSSAPANSAPPTISADQPTVFAEQN